MFYIVWKEQFTLYSRPQGNGYFVSYKDKLSDNYSKNWFDAKRFKTMGSALSRLGINCPKNLKSFDKFIEINDIDTLPVNRDKVLSNILSEEQEVKIGNFTKGRIEKIDESGNYLGNADDEIISYINSIINKNLKRRKSLYSDTNNYQQPKQTGINSWDGFY